MAFYMFKEAEKDGTIVNGSMEATNESEVIQYIKSRGKIPVNIELSNKAKTTTRKKNKSKNKSKDTSKNTTKQAGSSDESVLNKEINISLFTPKVKLKDIAVMCRQLGTMLTAGMDLIHSVEVLTLQTENVTLKKSLKEVSIELRKGNLLSRGMQEFPKVYPELLVAMVESGELTGTLDQVMESMAEHYKKEDKIQRQLKSAMMYPMILAIAAILVVTGLLVFVMPIFIEMFDGMPLPFLTQMVLNVSDSIRKYYYVYIGVIVLVTVGYKKIMEVDSVRYEVHRLIGNIPVMGTALSKIASSRLCRTLGTLLGSGIPIVRALEASAKVTGNEYIIQQMEEVVDEIKKGRFLNVLIKEMEYFPPMMVSMIAIGEESGDMEMMLNRTADYYDDEMDATVNDLVSAIQPIMILFMAVFIGIILIAMFLPIIESLSHLQDSL